MVKESIPDVLIWLSRNPEKNVGEALKALGLELLSEDKLWAIVKSKLLEYSDMAKRLGTKAKGPLLE